MPPYRIILAEGRPVRRQRWAALIRAMPGTSLVAMPTSLMEAYSLVEAEVPDLVLVCPEFRAVPEHAMFAEMMRLLGVSALGLDETPPAGPADPQVVDVRRRADNGPGRPEPARPGPRPPPRAMSPAPWSRVILIGASTGGVEALHRVLSAFPADCPPVLVVQHIRGAFSAAFADRLNRACRPEVAEAADGEPLSAGRILVAPGDTTHLELRTGGGPPVCRLVDAPPVTGHRPSVDALFRSAVALGPRCVGVLLTGMGRDGADGLLRLRRAGAHTIAQDRETSTVYGMPRVAAEIGAADEILPLDSIAAGVLRAASRPLALAAGGSVP